MKAPIIFVCVFLGCIYGSSKDLQLDAGLTPSNAELQSDTGLTNLVESQINVTNLFQNEFLHQNVSQHWSSIKQMFLSKNSGFLSILAKANPTTVHQILKLLYSLIKKNKHMVSKYNHDVQIAHTKVTVTKKSHDDLVKLLISKEGQLSNFKQKIMLMKARIDSAKGREARLRSQIALAKRQYKMATLKHRDAKLALSKNKPTYSHEIALIKQIIRMVKRLLPCKRGWIAYKGACYTMVAGNKVTWKQARKTCRSVGGRMFEMKAPIIFVCVFLGCIYGSSKDLQLDAGLTPSNAELQSDTGLTNLVESQINVTNLFQNEFLHQNVSQHWSSIKQMFLSKNSGFLSILAKANPTTVHQILKLLYSLIKKNKHMVSKYNHDVQIAHTKVTVTKKSHDDLVKLLISKEGQLSNFKQKIMLMKARIDSAKGREARLRSQIALAKRQYKMATLKHRDAKLAL